MPRDDEWFYREIRRLEPTTRTGSPDYGGRVMPVLELYDGIRLPEERLAFQRTLERMLTDPDEDVRQYAVDVCLGFFAFRRAFPRSRSAATEQPRPTSLQRAVDRALPIVADRAARHPEAGLNAIREQLEAAGAAEDPAMAVVLTSGLVRWMVDSYPDLGDEELSEALDWVERAAAAWYASSRQT